MDSKIEMKYIIDALNPNFQKRLILFYTFDEP